MFKCDFERKNKQIIMKKEEKNILFKIRMIAKYFCDMKIFDLNQLFNGTLHTSYWINLKLLRHV